MRPSTCAFGYDQITSDGREDKLVCVCGAQQHCAPENITMKIHTRGDITHLVREAQSWDRAIKSGGAAERAAFAAWIKRSPQHLQAYVWHVKECLLETMLNVELTGLDSAREFDLEALITKALHRTLHARDWPGDST